MKRNILLLMILTVISLGASGQKYTIYVDDFDSEIKIPNRAINLIRLAFIDGIRNTNRINVVDAVSAGSDLSLSPLEDARRFRAEYLLKGNLIQREATDDGSSHRRYHSRENSYKEKFTLRLDLIRTGDGLGLQLFQSGFQRLSGTRQLLDGKTLAAAGLHPVSYTHLDVYKRQIIF